MIELRHLKAVLAVAESGSVTQAARTLHLTQSALSHQLASLETYFETPLFNRGQRPLSLTAAGEALRQLAHRVLPEVENTRQALTRLKQVDAARELRIAVECHTCYDWLMPAMDAYRALHPHVEMDLVPGFHLEPLQLLLRGKADVVVLSEAKRQAGISYQALFQFEMVALTARDHALIDRPYFMPKDFANDTLITYPVPDHMLDVVRRVLKPAGVKPPRRTAELTVAILQLVASRRGIAALPRWAVELYIQRGYVLAHRIGRKGLWGRLYAATRVTEREQHAPFANLLSQIALTHLAQVDPI